MMTKKMPAKGHNKTRLMWPIMWILMGVALFTFFLNVGCSPDRESYLMDDPRSEYYAGLPIPTDEDWAYAREELISFYEARVRFQTDVNIDYFVSNGFWFAAEASRFERDSGLSRSIVGWLRGSTLSFRRRAHDDSLSGESLRRYKELRDRDSLWTLFESGEFWSDTLSFEALYKSTGITTHRSGLWVHAFIQIQVEALERENASVQAPLNNSGWMAYMAAIASHVFDSNIIELTPGRVPTKSVDYVAHQEKWFFELLSVTYDSKFAWTAIVGQHFGDSIMYRFVGEPLHHLEQGEVARYKSAAKAGDILTLTGKTLTPDQIASYQQLWHNAASTSETRVWKIGQGN